ncbi:MAG: hypothetical protein N2234_06750 [Planctomycetota bacterium]|nr:hypothetical protein [Planctomycetota bacterium]
MNVFLSLGLAVGGFILLFMELFLPSGILGVAASILMTAGVILAFVESTLFGVILLVVLVVAVPFVVWRILKILPKTSIGKAILLEGPSSHEEVATQPEIELRKLAGKQGTATSQLRPAGIAEIEGKRYQVISEGMIIDEGTKIEVIDVSGNRIMVRAVRDDDTKLLDKK